MAIKDAERHARYVNSRCAFHAP